MNKLNCFLLTVFVTVMAVQLNAQKFFFSPERPSNCAASDGILTIVPTRGVPPFTYLWSTGATEVSIKNIVKGAYAATLTDATGATFAQTHILNSEELDVTLLHAQPSSLCNPNSGALTVDPLGGLAPFSYTWSNGQTTASIQGLTAGTYSVTVQDANGCLAEGVYQVEGLTFNYYTQAVIATEAKPNCSNLSNGELSAVLYYNYYSPITYAWSNGAVGQSANNLSEGTYTVTITDALGCTASTSTFLQKDLVLTGNVVCNGSTTGSASAALVNATAPVSYVWANGQTGPSLTNVPNGQYAVTATDANGCQANGVATVAIPSLYFNEYTPKCYSGNSGIGYCWVNNDVPTSFLWDNGETNSWTSTLSQGSHSVTVTTSLGCTLSGSLIIPPPVAPPFTFTTAPSPADCSAGTGGAMNLVISGGIAPYTFQAYGPGGFYTSNVNSLQNIQGGEYQLSINSTNVQGCYGNSNVVVPDANGFMPSLVIDQIDCNTGYGSAAVVGVTTPGAQYNWSTGANAPALFNLTEGAYQVTVSAGASCNRFYEFYLNSKEDSLQVFGCATGASGKLINDLGVAGCAGTQGIPYQLIRTLPSGALNFTDENGVYRAGLAGGTFELLAANYDPADIACPLNAKHTVTAVAGSTITGLDFHFLNNNAIDHRVRQTALRTAQPGYPYSLRMEVCNDGATVNPGMLDLAYCNFLGAATGHHFPQHPGAFVLSTETTGIPNNSAMFSFPGVAAGDCEILQLDLQVPTTTPLNTAFESVAQVSPSSGDPTPDNNQSTRYSTVMGAFDPNCVLAYPARNGNPRDGGQILRYEDNTIVYQIFFQNTGNAPADLVVVRDPLDENLDLSTIRNITSSHSMKILTDSDDKMLVFKFENIELPDSTTDYAGSIGSIQYEIDLKPGVSVGTEILKKAAIYFDFNAPVITNQNVLEIVSTTKTNLLPTDNSIVLFPNPTDAAFGFYCDSTAKMSLFNALGVLISTQTVDGGLHQVSTADLPAGIYLVQLDTNGKIRSGKLVVSH